MFWLDQQGLLSKNYITVVDQKIHQRLEIGLDCTVHIESAAIIRITYFEIVAIGFEQSPVGFIDTKDDPDCTLVHFITSIINIENINEAIVGIAIIQFSWTVKAGEFRLLVQYSQWIP